MTVAKNMQDLQTVFSFYVVLVKKLQTTKQYIFNDDNDVINFVNSIFNGVGFKIDDCNGVNVNNNNYTFDLWQRYDNNYVKDLGIDVKLVLTKVNNNTLTLTHLHLQYDITQQQCPKYLKDLFKLQNTDVITVKFNDFIVIYSNYDSDGIVTFITKDSYYLKDVY